MSAQLLGPKMLRRISRATGHDVVRGWSHGGYWLGFVTADPEHLHGEFHTTTGEWEWIDDGCVYTSCKNSVTPPGQDDQHG